MCDEKIIKRMNYLKEQIRQCRADISVVEKYREDPESELHESSINIWLKLCTRLKEYQEELERLKGSE